jgi:hypothetical protein
MKTRFIFSPVVLLVVIAVVFSGCTETLNKFVEKIAKESMNFEFEDSVKWGNIVEQNIVLPSFNSIKAKGVTRIVVTQDTACSVRIRANEKCLEAYHFGVKRDELRVEYKDFQGNVDKNTPAITLYVTVPCLEEVEITGAGKMEVSGRMEQVGGLGVEINGVGEVCVDTLSVEGLKLELNGASECTLVKVTAQEDIEIEVNGAGNLNANVFCQELEVELNGAGKAVLSGECKNLVCEENGASRVDFSKLRR